jgi:hypothetical protein
VSKAFLRTELFQNELLTAYNSPWCLHQNNKQSTFLEN